MTQPHHKPLAITRLIDTKGRPHLAKTPTHEESELQGELFNVMRDSFKIIESRSALDAISFAKSADRWNHFGIWGTQKHSTVNAHAKWKWKRGKVLLIDFGTLNTGSEHSLPHPAIVLDEILNMLIVIPMTSEQDGAGKKKLFAEDMEKRIIRVSKEDARLKEKKSDGTEIQWRLKNDSIVLTHQIRLVDKNRIVNPITCYIGKEPHQMSFVNTPLMTEIEGKLSAHLCGSIHQDYVQLQSDVEALQSTIDERDKEIEELKQEMQRMKALGSQMLAQVAGADESTD